MSEWKTSICESGNELRSQIGLQFFAEGEDGGAAGADMDGDFGSDFEAGLFDGDLENQQTTEQDTGEGADGGLENQQPDGQQGEPEQQEQEGGEQPPAEEQPPAQEPPQLVPLVYNGQQIMLPQDAVQEIGRALGMDAIELLQKGMNYEHKNERELAVLNQYAAAANMTVPQFIQQLEQRKQAQELEEEVKKLKNEFPATEEGALLEIAKGRVAVRRNAQMQQAHAREAQMQQLRSRVDQSVQEMQKQREDAQWTAYEKETGIHTPDKIPPRVWELVNQGKTPMEAHWQYQSEQAKAELKKQTNIHQQQERNRQATTGSLAGAAVEEDAFLAGLYGN
ncbi:hypothetical protein [Candidatus Agathobaculum pullicola]|uniref:hypothetical protein n=1 Tax=Candidatus Agathobaculum pullicola TaxID=2838426 RepID=UPI003F92BEB7